MLAGTLAFISGIYVLMQFPYLPSFWFAILLLPAIFLSRFHSVFRLFLFFSLGFFWALIFANLKMVHVPDSEIENSDVFIKGIIASVPDEKKDYVRFLIDVKEIKDSYGTELMSPELVRLSWYKNKIIPVPGEEWQFKVKLKRPYGFMNSGGFDYEAWMLRKNIKATGYIKFDKDNRKIAEHNTYFIQKLRYKISQELKQAIDKPLLGLVLALSLGDRSQLSVKQRHVFTQTGTNHLIAISGLHLGLVAGFIYFLSGFFWSRFHFLTQRVASPVIASSMAFSGAFVYALLAGFGLPTQRALIMIAVFLVALFQVRQVLSLNVICIAVILILVLDPFAIISADFYLSFMAVIFILYITRFRINKHSRITQWFYLQCLLSFALFPILIFWFKQVPLYSVLANLVAIPVIGFLMVPLILVSLVFLFLLPGIAQYLYELIDWLYEFHWSWLKFLSQQNNAIVPISAPNIFSLLLAIIGILILMMPKGLPARYLGFFFFLPLLFPINEKLKQGEFDFSLLDVGQGLSAVIQTKEHILVYDTGALFSERFNIGDAVLKPYLRDKGINNISMLLISHGDNDHIGGTKAIVDNFRVDRILSSVPGKITDQFSNYEIEEKSGFCHAGQRWRWNEVDFEIIHPAKESKFKGNDASCVIKISSVQGSILLTGDIEKEAEARLIREYGDSLRSDILLVPHHGSKTSSTKEFIATVSPKYAFIPAGYRNRFGFPKEDIIENYHDRAVKTYITYETGEISAKFRDEGIQIDEFRRKNRRFWHH